MAYILTRMNLLCNSFWGKCFENFNKKIKRLQCPLNCVKIRVTGTHKSCTVQQKTPQIFKTAIGAFGEEFTRT